MKQNPARSSMQLVIDNGVFNVRVDLERLLSLGKQKGHPPRNVERLWSHLAEFAKQVDVARAQGIALGSTDAVGAIEDQIFRFNDVIGEKFTLNYREIRGLIRH